MKNFTIAIVTLLIILGSFYYLNSKAPAKEPLLYPGGVMLGQDEQNDSYIAVTIEEEGMKSILGNIVAISNDQRVVVTRFNGSLERLKESFRITSDGFSYTEFQSFGGNEYDSTEYVWKYDNATGLYVNE